MQQTITAKAFPILFPFEEVCKIFSRQWPNKICTYNIYVIEEQCTLVLRKDEEGRSRYEYAWTPSTKNYNHAGSFSFETFVKQCRTIAPPVKNSKNAMITDVVITCGENSMIVAFALKDKNKVNVNIKSRDALLFISQELQHLKKNLKTLEPFDVVIDQ
jgi:hypothetical protein